MDFLTSIRPPQVHAAKRPCRRLPRLLYVLSPEAPEVLGIIDVERIDCYADPCRSDIDAMMSFRDVRSMSWHRGGFLGFNLPVRVSVQNGLLLKSPLQISQASARNKKLTNQEMRKLLLEPTLHGTSRVASIFPDSAYDHARSVLLQPSCFHVVHKGLLRYPIASFSFPEFPGLLMNLDKEIPEPTWSSPPKLDASVGDTVLDFECPNDEGSDDSDDEKASRGAHDDDKLIACLKLASLTKPNVSVKKVLEAATMLLLDGDDRARVLADLHSGKIRIPQPQAVRECASRLDKSMMAFSQLNWNAGRTCVMNVAIDGSEQQGFNYNAILCDSLEWDGSMSSAELLQVEPSMLFRSFEFPLSCVGYGEKDLAHVLKCTHHQFNLLCGGDAWDRCRHSVIGIHTDQGGVERNIADAPNFKSMAEVEALVAEHSGGGVFRPRQPDLYMFPRAMKATGPLHICWNAAESAVKARADWPELEALISAALGFLHKRGHRERFVQYCLTRPEHKAMFRHWSRKGVDWKWEYMSAALEDLSSVIVILLDNFDSQFFAGGRGQQVDDDDDEIKRSAQYVQTLQRCKPKVSKYAADIEGLKVFLQGVAVNTHWFGGCDCHDWIWKRSLSKQAQARMFQTSVGGKYDRCWRRGRRASALARGHVRTMHRQIRKRWSPVLEKCMAKLSQEERVACTHNYQAMLEYYCEETGDKFGYWQRLPWIMTGIWPVDRCSQGIARQVLKQREELLSNGGAIDRISWQYLHEDGPYGFCYVLIKQLALDNFCDPDLEWMTLCMNLLSTTDQPGEGVHAKVKAISTGVGPDFQPPAVNALLHLNNNLGALDSWKAEVWFKISKFCHLREALVRFDRHSTSLFAVASGYMEKDRILYHCHPKQMYMSQSALSNTITTFKTGTVAKHRALTGAERLIIEHFRERLQKGIIFSLPSAMTVEAASDELSSLVDAPTQAAKCRALVTQTVDAGVESAGLPDVRMGRSCSGQVFFQVLVSSTARRFNMAPEMDHRVVLTARKMQLVGRSGSAGVFSLVPGEAYRLNLLAVLVQHGIPSIMSNLIMWKATNTVALEVRDHSLAASSGDIMGLQLSVHPSRVQAPAWHSIAEELIQWHLDMMNDEHRTTGVVAYLDPARMALVRDDGLASVTIPDLSVCDAMVSAGILIKSVSEFGEDCFRIVDSSYRWLPTLDILEGSHSAVSHLMNISVADHGRVSLLIALRLAGWQAEAGARPEFYAVGEPKEYIFQLSRPKMYFACLLHSESILAKLPVNGDRIPCIIHGMSAAYYHVLFHETQASKLLALLERVDATSNPLALTDADFDVQSSPQDVHPLGGIDVPPTPLESADPDTRDTIAIAARVLRSIPSELVDLTKSFSCGLPGGPQALVYFDNFSHSSGDQRAYTACLCKRRHPACFKYRQVRQFSSENAAVAWIAAWALEGLEQPDEPEPFSKAKHKKFIPSPEICALLERHVKRTK